MTAESLTCATASAAAAIIGAFDALGTHRTGSPGDEATTRWLIERLAALGVGAATHRFHVPLLEVHRAAVEVAGTVIAGHAQVDAGLTPPRGAAGPLVAADAARNGAVAVLDLGAKPPGEEGLERAMAGCTAAGAAGLVVVARRGAGSIFLANAPRVATPAPLPVLFVAPADAGPLLTGLRTGAEGRLVVLGVRRRQEATNVVAQVAAAADRADAPPVGVMTPKSGWFHCAAERGGGIVAWLAAAEAAVRAPRRARPVVLLATSGHELGHAGLEAYLLDHPDLAVRASPWVHLGASIGAAVQPSLRLFASDHDLLDRARAALDAAGAGPYGAAPVGVAPGGEARNIQARGGRYVSLAGGHAYFHTPEDRPDKVDFTAVARYAAAIADLVRAAVAE
jgi:hypothetical protein